MPNRILVIGATGMLGEPVTRQLHAAGHSIRVFTRNVEAAKAKFGADYEIVAGDVENPASLAAALQGCHGAHISLNTGPDLDQERRGMTNAAVAAARAGVQRITYLSGATVAPENTWYAGTKAKLAAEEALAACGVPYTIFRATFFMESLPRYVRGNRASFFGSQPHPWHWVAAADYARMVARAYATPAAANKTLTIHGPQPWTHRQALETYCAVVHPGVKVGALPFWMASLMAGLSRDQAMQAALSFFRYTERVAESGDPAEANALLDAPTTTLEQWSRLSAHGDQP